MIIYETINLINYKFYVGQHYTSADDGYLGSGKILKRAILKYGKDNFKRETLEFVNENNINEREVYWIAELSATIEYGNYNIMSGGNKPPVMCGDDNPSKRLEVRKKISEAMKAEKNYNWGKTTPPEVRKKQSEALKGEKNHMWGKKGKKHPVHGRKHTPEEIDRMRKTSLNSKEIKIDGETYPSIREAVRVLCISRAVIHSRLRSPHFPNYTSPEIKKKILTFYIKIFIDDIPYKSIGTASKILNIHRSTIERRLKSPTFPNYTSPKIKKNVLTKYKQVLIDGVQYPSIIDSSKKLNIEKSTIRYRLNSPNYPNYTYL